MIILCIIRIGIGFNIAMIRITDERSPVNNGLPTIICVYVFLFILFYLRVFANGNILIKYDIIVNGFDGLLNLFFRYKTG